MQIQINGKPFEALQIKLKSLEDERVDTISEEALRRIDSMDIPRLLIDMKAVEFVSSRALGLFVRLHQICEKKDGQFILANPGEDVKKLLGLTRLNEILTVMDTA